MIRSLCRKSDDGWKRGVRWGLPDLWLKSDFLECDLLKMVMMRESKETVWNGPVRVNIFFVKVGSHRSHSPQQEPNSSHWCSLELSFGTDWEEMVVWKPEIINLIRFWRNSAVKSSVFGIWTLVGFRFWKLTDSKQLKIGRNWKWLKYGYNSCWQKLMKMNFELGFKLEFQIVGL